MKNNSVTQNLKRPKFTSKDFLDGLSVFKRSVANEFLMFVKNKIENNHYDFSVVVENITGSQITNSDLSQSLVSDSGYVFTKNGTFVNKISTNELIQIFEKGRTDKGILPQPVIRKAFEEFRPIYRERFNNFLKGKL